ncbi:MAG: monovalent cation/H(+) antiporter subunit G [Candidatus Altiarchaeales archaeon]|nr:monovalent cation/H(+) antiporter subunit G [Candidatus Altiarchaeales archaeon]
MLDLAINLIATGFLVTGTFFFITATLGLLRFPDLFTRLHATGKGDTLGASLILAGIAIHAGLTAETVKILIILVFILSTSPVAAHAICRAIYVKGEKPWVKEEGK